MTYYKKQLIFFWLLIGFTVTINSQNCYEKSIQIIEQSKSDISIATIDSLLKECAQDSINYPKAAHKFSTYFYKKKKYSLAIKYAESEVAYLDKSGFKDTTHETAIYNLGLFYFLNREYQKAITHFEKVIRLHITSERVGQSYGELGNYYKNRGELYKALEYLKKGIHILETASDKNKYSERALVSVYINTATIYELLETKEASVKGIQYLKKVDSLVKIDEKNLSDYNFNAFNNQYANLYSNQYLNSFKDAIYYYHKNLKRALIYEDSLTISNSYLNLGELYLNHKNDSTLIYLKESLLFEENNHIQNAESYRNIANYYTQKKKYNVALQNIEKSLNWSFGIDENLMGSTPNELQLLQTSERRNIFKAIRCKIDILLKLYKDTKNETYLKDIINTVTISDQLVTIIIENSSEINTKLLWREEASNTYILGIKAAYLLEDIHTMFSFMEKNKALLLLQDIKENTQQFNLSKNIFDKKLQLKKEILALENTIANYQENDNYSKEKDTLFELKKYYEAFNDSIYKENPAYANKNLNIAQLSIDEVKKTLDAETIIISYALNDSYQEQTLYGLLLSKDKQYPFKTDNTPQLLENLEAYKKLISGPLKTKKELAQFKQVSYNLYNGFFPNDDLKKLIKNKHLIIVPDVTMQNIPFESLNTSNNSLDYLLFQNDISYAYSTSFLEHNSRIIRQPNKDFVGFAPVEFSNNNLGALYNTKDEILTINNIAKGATYLYKDASKDNFMNTSYNSKIIHLATHANAEKNPEIYFANDTIKLHELYTYKNNADLIVLSACETNLGQVKKGEGVFSLARGFFYAGANTVVSSLWNANDNSSSIIMNYFYEDLYDSKSKVKALNNAKRRYIQEHSLSETAPFYWASFVLIGDTDQTFEVSYTKYYTLFLIPIFMLFYFVRKKIR